MVQWMREEEDWSEEEVRLAITGDIQPGDITQASTPLSTACWSIVI